MSKANITIEIHDLRNEPSKIFTDAKFSAGVSRIINEKNELQVKYDRLLKDYELARHECRQKTEHISMLEEKQEGLLKEIDILHRKLSCMEYENKSAMHEAKRCKDVISGIKELIDLLEREVKLDD